MPEPIPQFVELEQRLRQGGVDGECLRRMIEELRDHYFDSVDDLVASGASQAEAANLARRSIGQETSIAAVVLKRNELLSWSARHPLAAACGRSFVQALEFPATPVVYFARERAWITRWGVSFGLAALLTGSLLLALNTVVN